MSTCTRLQVRKAPLMSGLATDRRCGLTSSQEKASWTEHTVERAYGGILWRCAHEV